MIIIIILAISTSSRELYTSVVDVDVQSTGCIRWLRYNLMFIQFYCTILAVITIIISFARPEWVRWWSADCAFHASYRTVPNKESAFFPETRRKGEKGRLNPCRDQKLQSNQLWSIKSNNQTASFVSRYTICCSLLFVVIYGKTKSES